MRSVRSLCLLFHASRVTDWVALQSPGWATHISGSCSSSISVVERSLKTRTRPPWDRVLSTLYLGMLLVFAFCSWCKPETANIQSFKFKLRMNKPQTGVEGYILLANIILLDNKAYPPAQFARALDEGVRQMLK